MAQGAQAADLPDLSDLPVLRGGITDGLSASTVNWQGAYVGGHIGYSSGTDDFSSATQSLSNFVFRNTNLQDVSSSVALLGKAHPNGTSFGGFVGYNAQWDDAVLGIEANYSRLSSFSASSSASYGPVNTGKACSAASAVDTCTEILALNGNASANVTDVLTLRGRAGWSIGNFMPYMFGGVALGRADIYRSVTPTVQGLHIASDGSTQTYRNTLSQFQPTYDGGNGVFMYGYTAGIGLETMLIGGLFARAEYEYVHFTKVKDIDIQINTVRAGLGYKF
ncbi:MULTISPECIES: outer membrane beta-barrel protein [unclassified Bradyrhizobium]|uniref:outer membrane protein n=1 Tax=unclassified Bradyrhizobium TaxID=2631580 RepID=UPI0020129C94|nr:MULTISPECIES: outer membrane beta-barrel protein [unclassified Bradyrhizobium]